MILSALPTSDVTSAPRAKELARAAGQTFRNAFVVAVWASPVRTIGKAGQTSSHAFTGVLVVQWSFRSRRRGDAKTTLRHLRQTCTSVYHPSVLAASFKYISKISRRTLSWSRSFVR